MESEVEVKVDRERKFREGKYLPLKRECPLIRAFVCSRP